MQAGETYSTTYKEEHERQPQHKKNNLEEVLALVEKPCRIHNQLFGMSGRFHHPPPSA